MTEDDYDNAKNDFEAWGFVKVYRKPLSHRMFFKHLEWLGAWLLIQVAADWQTHKVNLTDVGRVLRRDHNWDDGKWSRFTRRLEQEGFIRTLSKKNFGDKVGYQHIAVVYEGPLAPYDEGAVTGSLSGAVMTRTGVQDDSNFPSEKSVKGREEQAIGDVYKEVKNIEKEEAVAAVAANSHNSENLEKQAEKLFHALAGPHFVAKLGGPDIAANLLSKHGEAFIRATMQTAKDATYRPLDKLASWVFEDWLTGACVLPPPLQRMKEREHIEEVKRLGLGHEQSKFQAGDKVRLEVDPNQIFTIHYHEGPYVGLIERPGVAKLATRFSLVKRPKLSPKS